ncbi:uncharacterized protein LOC130498045 [Raphanus sativus]|uniref:Uncharacterized protein LOC130498045 n=1 Tax=Raphanus sativus TaxID=3726 RepID=A0A9W3C7B5_RAPSA|nr:uncharacterized protein LOC130498045 [Raphanus sativus]
MRCDNYCPRCGETEESVTHAIFECPPALQVWLLSSTPMNADVFPAPSIYTNMDYLFWQKNGILEPEQDRDPYPWLIWYICKVRNDKFFREIDRDPLELVRYTESECQAWFNANKTIPPEVQKSNVKELQVISLGNICLLDGSWTSHAQFSECGWVWLDSGGNTQLIGSQNFSRRESAMHSEVGSTAMCDGEYASAFNKSELQNRLQRIDCYDQRTSCLVKFCYGTREDRDIAHMLPGVQDFLCSKSA